MISQTNIISVNLGGIKVNIHFLCATHSAPEPAKGISTQSPAFAADKINFVVNACGFCVGWRIVSCVRWASASLGSQRRLQLLHKTSVRKIPHRRLRPELSIHHAVAHLGGGLDRRFFAFCAVATISFFTHLARRVLRKVSVYSSRTAFT